MGKICRDIWQRICESRCGHAGGCKKDMPRKTLCKTVHQYNKTPLSDSDMQRLQEIADDYRHVKNYVYERYGGIGGLPKLYPGYTVQNEMTQSGLREQLGLPSVYFYLAVFEALADIKNQWTQAKARVSEAVRAHAGLAEEEAHYLRFILKVNNAMSAILNQEEVHLTRELQEQYDRLALAVDTRRLDNYLKRQVRKTLAKLHTEKAEGFAVTKQAYRYGEHGIYIAAKEKRRRIFIPLTDGNSYERQLYVKLDREKKGIELLVPIDVSVREHEEYQHEIGLSLGMFTMLTTDSGHTYGETLGEFVTAEAEWVRQQNAIYRQNKTENPGRKKYREQKRRLDAALRTYVNAELNRFLREEKPQILYLPRLPAQSRAGQVKEYNRSIRMWKRGYIRERLQQKCREHSIETVEVFGKDISRECCECGALGKKEGHRFRCTECGLEISDRVNAAKNAIKRGQARADSVAEPCGGCGFLPPHKM